MGEWITMNRDDDINVPNMGPAEPIDESRSPQSASPSQKGNSAAPVVEVQRSGGFLQALVSIVLIAAVSALGYFGFDMYDAQKQKEATFTQAQKQIEELRELLKQTEQGAEQSGQAIQGNVSSLEESLKQKDKQLDSEIAKLWAIAHQKNAPLIKEQGNQIKTQEATIKTLQATVANQAKELKALSSLKSESAKLKKSVNAEVEKINKLVTRIETEVRTSNEINQDQQDEVIKTQRSLSDRVTKLEGKSTAGLERRVKVNEQAVRAFDGTRRQLNQDLLQVKQKLNNLQLQLEQK